MRNILLVALGLLLAPSLSAQTVSVGYGEYYGDNYSNEVAEVFVATPGLFGLVPGMTFSFDADGNGEPTILPQLGFNFTNYPVAIGADVGASATSEDYGNFEPHVQARVSSRLFDRFALTTIASWQFDNDWNRGVVIKVDYNLWPR